MKRTLHLLAVAALVLSAVACSKDPSTTNADSLVKPASILDKLKPEPKITIPAGTKLRVALLEAVSSCKSRPGDQFRRLWPSRSSWQARRF